MSAFSRRNTSELCVNLSLKKIEGAGNAGCSLHPQPRARNKERTSVVTTGPDGFNRHSPRNGFNGLLRDLPGDRAFLSPSLTRRVGPKGPTSPGRKLDAGVEASGPHDFAVRYGVVRLSTQSRPPHPAPNVRDDGETSLLWAQDVDDSAVDLGKRSIARHAAHWHDGQITRTGKMPSSAMSSAKLDPVARA
jgi:hypothetical protein